MLRREFVIGVATFGIACRTDEEKVVDEARRLLLDRSLSDREAVERASRTLFSSNTHEHDDVLVVDTNGELRVFVTRSYAVGEDVSVDASKRPNITVYRTLGEPRSSHAWTLLRVGAARKVGEVLVAEKWAAPLPGVRPVVVASFSRTRSVREGASLQTLSGWDPAEISMAGSFDVELGKSTTVEVPPEVLERLRGTQQ
ncbi:MAG: hypothetical protein GQE15_35410 [Archangiaceae bacterium]|nr:hypothetical protein [Archangiaceae bacterium]